MRKTYLIILLSILVFNNPDAQEIQIRVKRNPDSADIEGILKQSKNFGRDFDSLNRYIAPLLNSPDKKYRVLSDIFLAEGYSFSFDSLNEKSNILFEKAIADAEKISPELEILANIQYAKYLYKYRNMSRALPRFLRANRLLEQNPKKKHILPDESYKWLGYYFGTIGDAEAAEAHLNRARELAPKGTNEYAGILDALGLHYLAQSDLESAEKYFLETIELAKNVGDELRYAKALGNQATILMKKGNLEQAKSMLKQDIEISERLGNDQNTIFANTLMAEVCLMEENLQEAENHLNKAYDLARTKEYFAANEIGIEELRTRLYNKMNRPEDELKSYNRIVQLEKQLEKTDGQHALNQVHLLMQKARLQKASDEANYINERAKLMRKVYLIILTLTILLAAFIFANSRKVIRNRELVYKQKVMGLEMEKLKIEQKLSETQETLDAQVAYLKNKNLQISKLKNEIEVINQSRSHYLEKEKGYLHALLESHLMTDENWENFKREFRKVYPGFYSKLKAEYPDLTDSSYRLILLKKLEFTNSEIAGLTGVTIDAVKKSNQRLKKKLGDRYDELSEIISRV